MGAGRAADPTAQAGRARWLRTADRDVLEGIAFVLSTGIGWTKLPLELGYGSGWTCWRRLHEWQHAGVFDRLHQAVLDELGGRGLLDWSRANLDSVSVRAKRGGELTGPNPTDRAKRGSEFHLLVEATGLPLNVAVSGAHRKRQHARRADPGLDAGDQAGGRGHPRRRPLKLHADKCYDVPRVRRYLRRRGIAARIARIRRDSSARLGRHHWVVERTLRWLLSHKRLTLRHDRTAVTINALARLAVTLICARRLPSD